VNVGHSWKKKCIFLKETDWDRLYDVADKIFFQ